MYYLTVTPTLTALILALHCQVPLPPQQYWHLPESDPIVHVRSVSAVARECWDHGADVFALGCNYRENGRRVLVIPEVSQWTSLNLQRCIFWHEDLHTTVEEDTLLPSGNHEGWKVP